MKHFLEISQLSSQEIEKLLDRAFYFKQHQQYPAFPKHALANLFYENSTRTRVSFELAALRLSLKVIHLELQNSSENKGEIIEDTIQNLAAMGIRYFVIRHKLEGLQQNLASHLDNIHIINAGDGTHAHPSQALLDIMTILEQKNDLSKLKIAVLGDIRHSRVANSFQCICKALGVGELVLISPKLWKPQKIHYGRVTDEVREGLTDADVVMCLRVQNERLLDEERMALESYKKDFTLNQQRLAYAKPNAMVMHPGPLNRGVEIESDVADGSQSYILQQVTNGVFARMAIIEGLIEKV